jgi:uncharacterized membrane protein
MRNVRNVRRAAIRLGGITLAGAAALVGVGGPADAAPYPNRAGQLACTWAAQVLPTMPTAEFAANGVNGTDGDETFAGYSNGHAVLWRDGRLIDLGGGGAEDVNRGGDAVGVQLDSNYVPHATLFRAGTAIRLAEPANASETRATGINEAGFIVGAGVIVRGTEGTFHALVWSARTPGSVTDLGTLHGDEANGIRLVGVNERGMLIGNAFNANTGTSTAVIGTVRGGLRALPGSAPAASTTAVGITGRYIVGTQYLNGSTQPVRWVNGRAQVLPGDAEANGVNRWGTVVGRRSDLSTAVIWTGVTDPVELPIPAGLQQPGATAITDRGTVAGFGFDNTSAQQPVLWSCR